MDVPLSPSLPVAKSRRGPFLLVVAIFAVVLYWWWPGLAGAGDPDTDPDVLVIANGAIADAREVVSRRLREEGFTVGWNTPRDAWCDLRSEIDALNLNPSKAVVIFLDPMTSASNCDLGDELLAQRILYQLQVRFGARVLVVTGLDAQTDPVVNHLERSGATVVNPSSLLGESGLSNEHVGCLWWDDCLTDASGVGYVIVRDENGLTMAGQQRVARAIVAGVQ